MRSARTLICSLLALVALLSFAPATAQAQGKAKHKHYVVTSDKAVRVTRTVLVQRGYTVIRIDRVGGAHVVYYRRGNMGRGKGKGPIQRMVIRTVRDRVVFEEAEPSVLVDIDVKLKL
jgi:lipopolysaccharide export system protein LptA